MNIHVKHINSRHGFAHGPNRLHNDTMNIAKIRRARGLTQLHLAEMAAITQPTVSRAEKGEDGCTIGVYKSIASALEVNLADLFSSDRTAAETELLTAFRQLPLDRQLGWLDLARLAVAPSDKDAQ